MTYKQDPMTDIPVSSLTYAIKGQRLLEQNGYTVWGGPRPRPGDRLRLQADHPRRRGQSRNGAGAADAKRHPSGPQVPGRGRRWQQVIYFDNAATTFPKPPCVAKAVQEALVRYGANPGRGGHDLSIETARRVYRCRELAAQLFCCQPEQVVFTKNCTESLNIVIKGVLRPGTM